MSQTWIKAYALTAMSDGTPPAQALKQAREAWEQRQENERILDEMMKEENK